MSDRSDLTDLLQPTLQGKTAETAALRKKPWGLRSLFFVAFFGGLLAVTVMALLNARRLQVTGRERAGILVVAAIAFALLGGYVVLLPQFPVLDFVGDVGLSIRLGGRVVALLAYALYARSLRPSLRVYDEVYDSYASPWLVGLAVVFGLGSLQAVAFVFLYIAAGGAP